jgi:hypothetical protein
MMSMPTSAPVCLDEVIIFLMMMMMMMMMAVSSLARIVGRSEF